MVGGGQGFAGPERFGGRFDRYRASQPDRREVGSQAPGKEYFDKHEERWTAYTAQRI